MVRVSSDSYGDEGGKRYNHHRTDQHEQQPKRVGGIKRGKRGKRYNTDPPRSTSLAYPRVGVVGYSEG